MLLFNRISNYKFNYVKFIHNQSYINLENKYNKLTIQNKILKNNNKNLNNIIKQKNKLILNLNYFNNQLINKNKKLNSDLPFLK